MKHWMIILMLLLASQLAAAQAPTFEYGKLFVVNVPGDKIFAAVWSAGDSGRVQLTAEIATAKDLATKTGGDSRLVVFNMLGRAGWELVAEEREVGVYLFKRRR